MAARKRDPTLDDAIVAGAAAVLAETGYGDFAIEVVAQRLRIPKSTIYRRWRSRAHLLAHVSARRLSLMSEIDAGRADDLRAALVHRVTEEIALSRTRDGLALAQALLAARDTEQADSDELVAAAERRRDDYVLLLGAAHRHRRLPPDVDIELTADLLLGAVWGPTLWSHPRTEGDAARLVEAVLPAIRRDHPS